MNREEAIDILFGCIEAHSEEENEALDMAIEALKREDHDGCDGCRYEANHELSLPCVGCKQNYVDKYVPMPEHDREWIIGCIKHDGFVKTDRGDNANQIILDALSADNTSTNTSTKSTNISTDTSADRPRGEWIETAQDYYETVNKKGGGVNENTEYFTDDIACSECLTKFSNIDNETERFNFCPNCGADMRSE